jgi:hypothetical protein
MTYEDFVLGRADQFQKPRSVLDSHLLPALSVEGFHMPGWRGVINRPRVTSNRKVGGFSLVFGPTYG